VLLESCRPTTVSASGVALNRLRITTKPTATATSRPALSALPLHSNLTERHSGHRTSPPAGTSLAAPAFGRSRRVVWARSGRPVPVEGWSVRLAASLRSHRHVRRSQTGPTCTLGWETVGATFADDNLDLFVRTARDPAAFAQHLLEERLVVHAPVGIEVPAAESVPATTLELASEQSIDAMGRSRVALGERLRGRPASGSHCYRLVVHMTARPIGGWAVKVTRGFESHPTAAGRTEPGPVEPPIARIWGCLARNGSSVQRRCRWPHRWRCDSRSRAARRND
jgi:hypothetical protein